MPMHLDMSGFDEIQGELKLMREALRDAAVRDSVRVASAVMRDEMRAHAPVLDKRTAQSTALEPHELKDGIRSGIRKLADGFFLAIIGPRRGTGRAAHLVEYGHRLVKGGKSHVGVRGAQGPGHEVGEVEAYPFLRPAYEVSAEPTFQAYAQALKENLRRWLS